MLLTVGNKFVFLTTVAAVKFQSKRSKKGRNEGLHAPSHENLLLSMQCVDFFFVLAYAHIPGAGIYAGCDNTLSDSKHPFADHIYI